MVRKKMAASLMYMYVYEFRLETYYNFGLSKSLAKAAPLHLKNSFSFL